MKRKNAYDVFILIDKIRHENKISIISLCENIIDTKSYYRFLRKIRIPRLDSVLNLISKLGLSYIEFHIILEKQ